MSSRPSHLTVRPLDFHRRGSTLSAVGQSTSGSCAARTRTACPERSESNSTTRPRRTSSGCSPCPRRRTRGSPPTATRCSKPPANSRGWCRRATFRPSTAILPTCCRWRRIIIGRWSAWPVRSCRRTPGGRGYLQKARRLAGDDRSKTQRAALLYLESRVAQQRGDAGRARALFRESVQIDRAVTNQAHRALRELRATGRNGHGTRLATSPHGLRPFDRLRDRDQRAGPLSLRCLERVERAKGRG